MTKKEFYHKWLYESFWRSDAKEEIMTDLKSVASESDDLLAVCENMFNALEALGGLWEGSLMQREARTAIVNASGIPDGAQVPWIE